MNLFNEPPIMLKKFIQLNLDDSEVFTLSDSKNSKIFTGNASEFLDACLEDSRYHKYLKWYVVYFSPDMLYISENINYMKGANRNE